MTRFRLAFWVAILGFPLLTGCNCFDKFCCYRRPCCPSEPVIAATPVVPAVAPAPCCPPTTYGSSYLGPIYDGGTPGCTKGCGLVGMPASIANGAAAGAPAVAGPIASPGMGFPPFSGLPELGQGGPVPTYPGPIMTAPPGGGLPAPNTVEPPPVGSLPPLSPVPRLTPAPTPGTPPAQPVPADPVSRQKK